MFAVLQANDDAAISRHFSVLVIHVCVGFRKGRKEAHGESHRREHKKSQRKMSEEIFFCPLLRGERERKENEREREVERERERERENGGLNEVDLSTSV